MRSSALCGLLLLLVAVGGHASMERQTEPKPAAEEPKPAAEPKAGATAEADADAKLDAAADAKADAKADAQPAAAAAAADADAKVEEEPAAPEEGFARAPLPAKVEGDGVYDVDGHVSAEGVVEEGPVVRWRAEKAKRSSSPSGELTDPMHVRAADGKVVIHPDEQNGYNAGGAYLGTKDTAACCNICPKSADCLAGSGCYQKCHHFCGPQCVVPAIDMSTGSAPSACTIGVNCGLFSSGITAQDMAPGWKAMKAGKPTIPGTPTAAWARPPLDSPGGTGPAPTKLPVAASEVHEPQAVTATGAAGPGALGQPLAAGEEGPSTPSAAAAQYQAKAKAAAAADCAKAGGAPGCQGGDGPAPAAELLEVGARYAHRFRSGH